MQHILKTKKIVVEKSSDNTIFCIPFSYSASPHIDIFLLSNETFFFYLNITFLKDKMASPILIQFFFSSFFVL